MRMIHDQVSPGPALRRTGVLVIGGGASGAILALHLRAADPGRPVLVIERRATRGRGLAYAPRDARHLLNTRARQMSALADAPGDFCAWLDRFHPGTSADAYVPRRIFGDYLEARIAAARAAGGLDWLQDSCVALEETAAGIVARLAAGGRVLADAVVLATGNLATAAPRAETSLAPGATVAIIGTGLSMVDRVLSLRADGHRGPILALSRRGLLPASHLAPSPAPREIAAAEVPLGAPLSLLLRWLRALVAAEIAAGGDWRQVIDGLRPHLQPLWQGFSPAMKARFLRHLAGRWEVLRHRMPPQAAVQIAAARASGQLQVLRAGFLGASPLPQGGTLLRLAPRGPGVPREIAVDRLEDCRGIRQPAALARDPLMQALLARGLACRDASGSWLSVDAQGQLIDADGRPNPRLRAIGPTARAAFWESTAIAEIRQQAAQLAVALAPLPASASASVSV